MTTSYDNASLGTVDVAAIALAGLGASVTLMTASGDWSAASTFVGLALVLIILAFHRSPARGVPREWVVRAAFGAVLALATACMVAWPMQVAIGESWRQSPLLLGFAEAAGVSLQWSLLIGILLGATLAAKEPVLSRMLDGHKPPAGAVEEPVTTASAK